MNTEMKPAAKQLSGWCRNPAAAAVSVAVVMAPLPYEDAASYVSPQERPNVVLTRAGSSGRSRTRLPVARAKALAIAATVGPEEASPHPSERSSGLSRS